MVLGFRIACMCHQTEIAICHQTPLGGFPTCLLQIYNRIFSDHSRHTNIQFQSGLSQLVAYKTFWLIFWIISPLTDHLICSWQNTLTSLRSVPVGACQYSIMPGAADQ